MLAGPRRVTIRRVSYWGVSMSRVVFIIDGFNLYHSLVDAQSDLKKGTKWLNVKQLCFSYLSTIGEKIKTRPILDSIFYFSASPSHRSKETIFKHSLYMQCLEASGVCVKLGRFKRKAVTCYKCGAVFNTHEEKESDVAIGVKLVEICSMNKCDLAVLVSGDTDLLPAVQFCNDAYPAKPVVFIFPYKRKNKELAEHALDSFTIKPEAYCRCQLSDPVITASGRILRKPDRW